MSITVTGSQVKTLVKTALLSVVVSVVIAGVCAVSNVGGFGDTIKAATGFTAWSQSAESPTGTVQQLQRQTGVKAVAHPNTVEYKTCQKVSPALAEIANQSGYDPLGCLSTDAEGGQK